jgi:geranylgeranyl diphosphate synthase type II
LATPSSERLEPHPIPVLKSAIDARLTALLPLESQASQPLNDAIRYSLLAPGKRVRPLLALFTAHHCGADWRRGIDPACALEMVHTASLILDDLPSMDNAKLRRGSPTVHRRFGEDIAVLAAVALLNQAFAVLAEAPELEAGLRLELVGRFAFAIGPAGLVTGQSRDLHEHNTRAEALEEINRQKTGVLFSLAVEVGLRVAAANAQQTQSLVRFARSLGQAFQARDDLLDRTGSSSQVGKDVGKDAGKTGLMEVVGEAGVREAFERHAQRALDALAACPGDDPQLRSYVLSMLSGPSS